MRKLPIVLLALCLLALLVPAASLAAEKLPPPVVNPFKVGDTVISGTGVPGATVYFFPGHEVGQGTSFPFDVASNGTWKITGHSLYAGEQVLIWQEHNGADSDSIFITLGDAPSPPQNPQAELDAANNQITVRWNPPAYIPTGYDVGDIVYRLGRNDPSNNYYNLFPTSPFASIPMEDNFYGFPFDFSIVAETSDANFQSAPVTCSFTVPVPPPTIDEPIYAGADVTVTGTCIADNVTISRNNGFRTFLTPSYGIWKHNYFSLAPGDVISVTQTMNGTESDPATATVGLAPPTIDPPSHGDRAISGTGYPGAEIQGTISSIGPIRYIPVDPTTGTWSVGPSPSLGGGTVITVTQTFGGITSDPATAIIPVPPPTINEPIYAGTDVEITGTCDLKLGTQVNVTLPNTAGPIILIPGLPTWSTTATLVPGDVISVTQTMDGIESDPATATVGLAPPTVNQPYHGDITLSGTGYPGATVRGTYSGNPFDAVVDSSNVWVADLGVPLSAGTIIAVDQSFHNQTSGPSTPVTVLAANPGAPTALSATPGDQQVTLAWSAPASDGGSPVRGYTITEKDSQIAAIENLPATAPLSYTVPGLQNGVSYTFQIQAVTDKGPSATAVFEPATPNIAPNAPQSPAATAASTAATLTWQPPLPNGGTIDAYEVTLDGGGTWLPASGTLSHEFTGLQNGQPYTFGVRARNNIGESPAAYAQPVTPAGGPTAPQNVTATPGVESATLQWTAPTDTGGSPLLGYRVSGDGALWQDLPADADSHTFTGLTNGQTYTLYVKAFTAVSESPAATAQVTPLGNSDDILLTIDPVYEYDPYITGTCEAGSQIYLVFGGSARQIAPYRTLGAGSLAPLPGAPASVSGDRWHFNVSGMTLRAGDPVTVIQTMGGVTKNILRATVASRTGTLPPVIVNPPAPGDTEISGTAVPGATITITGPDGTPIGTTQADPDGNWTYPLPAPIQPDDVYLVTQTVGPNTSAPIPAAPAASGKAATKEFEAPPSGYGVITGSRVNARERPSLDATVLTQLSQGTRVRIVDWGMTGDDGSGPWCKITVGDQMYFVHNDYVDGTAPF